MKYKVLTLLFLASVIVSFMSCSKLNNIDGNGHVLSETRQLVSFNQVVNSDIFDVYVSQDSIYQVVVEAESNLIPYIRTIVNGSSLEIDSRDNLRPGMPIKIYVSTPYLESMRLSGSGSMTCDSLIGYQVGMRLSGSGNMYANANAAICDFEISGSGNITATVNANVTHAKITGSGDFYLDGFSDEGNFKISGSGNINAYDLHQNSLDASISGSGNMYVNVADFLKATISGSGSIYYLGDPSTDVKVTGSGSVIKR